MGAYLEFLELKGPGEIIQMAESIRASIGAHLNFVQVSANRASWSARVWWAGG